MSSTVETGGIIRVLPDRIADKIAAGEVVQRPASVVKELVENALDAGADTVTVIVKDAGRELIQVVDDGCGMSARDAEACFRRHATSKISGVEDLEAIRTLGFRGEALTSIAAVAQVELKTRLHDEEAGHLVEIHGGEIEESRPCAHPPGTSVAVRNLFYNVPARRNFLKTPATEFKHVAETFEFSALAHPDVSFELIHNGNTVHDLDARPEEDAGGRLKGRILDLFGEEHADQLIGLEESTSYLSLRGFVGRPDFSRTRSDRQFLFVNDRYVNSRYLSHAVASGYGEMLPTGSFPFFALFLDLDPRHVDVNVHPTKKKVDLDDERGVYGFVRAVVKKALATADIAPQVGYDEEGRLSERSGSAIAGSLEVEQPGGSGDSDADPGELTERLYRGPDADGEEGGDERGRPTERIRLPAGSVREDADLPDDAQRQEDDRLMWQLHEKYILTRIRSGLMILDQHAAHERILYEKALETMEDGLGMSQQLIFPHTLEFEAADYGLLEELLPDLRALGFDLKMDEEEQSVAVHGVPADIRVGDERTILEEILDQYKSYAEELSVTSRKTLAKSIACRSAITAGDMLSVPEMRSLIDQLFGCEMPWSCPHGRPTMIKVSTEELDKRFGRGEGHVERHGTVQR